MSNEKKTVVGRADFVRNMVKAGFKYADAIQAYESMMSTIADGVAAGNKVCLGNTGCLEPSTVPPRHIKMGFARGKGGKVRKLTREYFLDSRVKYKFNIYRGFMEKQQLHWTRS